MDFISVFPKNVKQHDSIMVVVDKLSKETHCILLKSTYKAVNIANIFMKEIFRLHSVPKVVISYKDANFIVNFWKDLFKGLGTQLNFTTTYHPQIDGQRNKSNFRINA